MSFLVEQDWRSDAAPRPTDEQRCEPIHWQNDAMDFFTETARALSASLERPRPRDRSSTGFDDEDATPQVDHQTGRADADRLSLDGPAASPVANDRGSATVLQESGCPTSRPALPGTSPNELAALESDRDSWQERAVIWRERALASLALARELQDHIDDLRANIDDLRLATQAGSAEAVESAALEVSEPASRRRFSRKVRKPREEPGR
jgi:hypothetical protein